MKILVPVKSVAALDEDFELDDDGRSVDPDYCDYEVNEWDNYSLETALQLKEANADAGLEVVAVTVGDDDAEDALRSCLAKGADKAIRVWDDSVEGSDPMSVARLLAKVAEREQAELVFAGVQSSDYAHARTGMHVAGLLDRPHVAVVSALEYTPGSNTAVVRRELEGGLEEEIEVDIPAVLSIQLGINNPRYASLRGIKQAKSQPIEELTPADLGVEDTQVGEPGSLSKVRRMYIPEKGGAEMIEGTPAEQAARLAQIIKEFGGA